MRYLEVLPMVVVMVSGPQILSAIFLATSEHWRENSVAFVVGASLSIPLVITTAYLLNVGIAGQETPPVARTVIVLVALLLAMIHTYRTREDSEPPRWMGTLESASPRFSFRLGFLLMGFFPTDVLTSVAVGSYLAARGSPLSDAIPFVLTTLLILALPSLALVAGGERTERALPSVRDWMNTNSWIVSEAVILFFVAMTLSNLVG